MPENKIIVEILFSGMLKASTCGRGADVLHELYGKEGED
jgi:hypothetical protein